MVAQIEAGREPVHSVTWDEQCLEEILGTAWEVRLSGLSSSGKSLVGSLLGSIVPGQIHRRSEADGCWFVPLAQGVRGT